MWSLSNAEQSGREQLMAAYGNDCARISRTHAVLEAIQTSQLAGNFEDRIVQCQKTCESVERVLRDIGLAGELRRAREQERTRLYKQTHLDFEEMPTFFQSVMALWSPRSNAEDADGGMSSSSSARTRHNFRSQ